MAGDWRQQQLGDVITLKRGYDLASTARRPGNVPIISSSGVSGFHDTAMSKGPGVVTGRYGTIGEVFYTSEDFWPLNTTLYVSDFKGSDPRFVSYYLKTINFSAYSDKAAVPGINRNDLHEASVLWPGISEQIAIAGVLASLDAKIDLSRQMALTLEGMARALFKSWFVDFDPVHAKAEGRDPGLPADIAALFPGGFDDEGFPSGWGFEPLLRFADLISGGTPKTYNEAYWNGSIPWASAKDVSQCGQLFLDSTERTITELGLNESSIKIVPASATVVVARGATTGRNCIFANDMAMNQTCYALKSKEGFDFWFNLSFRNEIDRIVSSAHGSAFDTITTSTLQNANIVPAAEGIRRAFEKQVSALFQRALTSTTQAKQLAEMRDILLPKLLSGELRVADTETVIAAA